MITSAETLSGFEVVEVLGVVEGVAEGSFPVIGIGNVGIEKGGGMDALLHDAKTQLARVGYEKGANAVVAFRYQIVGRHTEKSVVAYGTAVRCKKITA